MKIVNEISKNPVVAADNTNASDITPTAEKDCGYVNQNLTNKSGKRNSACNADTTSGSNDKKNANPKKKKQYKGWKLYRVLRAGLKLINKFLWPAKVINKENMNKVEGALVICNHYTKADALILTRWFFKKELHVVIKSEAFDTAGISNWFLHKMGGIPVRRGEPDIDAVKTILNVLKDDKKLIIYPEGTRNKEGTKDMAPFKSGVARFAIKTQKPVIPMIFYRAPKFGRMTYLYVGEPFYMDGYYNLKKADGFEAPTEFIYKKMLETRKLCDEYVAEITNGKLN